MRTHLSSRVVCITIMLLKNLSRINVLRLKTLEAADVLDKLNEGVELLLGVLVLVTLTAEPDADALGRVSHALLPQVLVNLGVDTDLLGSHRLLGELLHLLNSLRRLGLEGRLVRALRQVDGVVAAHEIGLVSGHLCKVL